jgi:hypothetical protein
MCDEKDSSTMTTDTKLWLSGMLTFICAISAIASKGDTGVGWWVLGMIVIWGMID